MNELIPITVNENEEPIVSARTLYDFLDISERYSKWFERMTSYGFAKDIDYTPYQIVHPQNNQELEDHALKLDMARELSMIQRNEKGKQARQYFIQVEKDYNSPEKIMARALKIADATINTLHLEVKIKDQLIGEMKPKADYTDKILKSKSTMNINAIAKDYGMSARGMNKILHELGVQYYQDGQWLLYAKHQGKGYTHSQTIDFERKDGTPDTRLHTQWRQKGRLFIYELLKSKKGILPLIEQ